MVGRQRTRFGAFVRWILLSYPNARSDSRQGDGDFGLIRWTGASPCAHALGFATRAGSIVTGGICARIAWG